MCESVTFSRIRHVLTLVLNVILVCVQIFLFPLNTEMTDAHNLSMSATATTRECRVCWKHRAMQTHVDEEKKRGVGQRT